MRRGTRRPAFDIAQIDVAPELAADLIRIAAIDREIARESPVAVVLAPGGQPVLMRHLAETGDIIFGNHIGHGPAQIPEELIRRLGAVDHPAGHHGQVFDRIIAGTLFEINLESVGPVLRAHFITVDGHALPRFLLFRRDLFEQLSEHGVEVVSNQFLAHLVHFQPGSLWRGGPVLLAGRNHAEVDDRPVSSRQLAGERPVRRQLVREVDDLSLLDQGRGVIRLDCVPEFVGLPGRARRRMHPAQLLFDNLVDSRFRGQFHGVRREPAWIKLKLLRGHFLKAEDPRAVRNEIRISVASARLQLRHLLPPAILQRIKGRIDITPDRERPCLERFAVAKTDDPCDGAVKPPGRHGDRSQHPGGLPACWMSSSFTPAVSLRFSSEPVTVGIAHP